MPDLTLYSTHGEEDSVALHFAASQGAAGAVRYLGTTMGATGIDTPTSSGFTALH